MTESLRMLLVEDSADDEALMLRELTRAGFAVEHERVETAEVFERALAGGTWDLVVADYLMPRFSGLEALRITREHSAHMPFIIVSGKVGEDVIVGAVREGADDYVLKSSLVRLAPAVRRALDGRVLRDAKHAADALLALQAAALDAAADAIVITGADGRIVYANAAFEGLTGYSPMEASGLDLIDLLKSGAHDDAFYSRIWATVSEGAAWRGEIVCRRKDGHEYVEHQTITPVLGEDGKAAYYVAFKQDMTAQRELEAHYLQAQKMETVGRLAGGIAHDFNNLLTVINGSLDLALSATETDSPLLPDLKEARSAGERAAALTRRLLAFGRRQTMRQESLHLTELVGGMHSMLQRLIGERIELFVRSDGDPAPVWADVGQLEQVVLNLVVNARDAMPDGGRLTLETRVSEVGEGGQVPQLLEPGTYSELIVSDTGEGMDAVTRGRIFEPFFTTKREGEGTGLGLATVYGIVAQCGGTVDVESSPGQGSTFHVYLPRAGSTSASSPRAPVPGTQAVGTETVLVVDDEPVLASVTARMLERAGYAVLTAAGATEALALLADRGGPVDLLVTDLAMPDMGGWELAETIRALHPTTKVLFMSGYADDTVAPAHVRPDERFIAKPFGSHDLAATVRELLDHSS